MTKERIPNEELVQLAKREEPRFLSILLKDKDNLMDCVAFEIKQDHFWFDDNRFLYKVILDNYKKYGSLLTRTSMDSIMDMQANYSEEQRSARKMYWDQIYNIETSSEDYEFLKNSINARYLQQQMYDIFKDNSDRVVKATSKQSDIIAEIREKMAGLEGVDPDSYTVVMGIQEGMGKALEHIVARRERPHEQAGIFCGIQAIDNIFYGFMPGSYTVITGLPGGGKTTTMFNMAFGMAKKGYSIVYVSMEKEAIPLYLRLLALHASVDYNRIKRGGKHDRGIPQHIFDAFIAAKNDLLNNIKPNFECIQVAPGTKLSKILSKIDKIKAKKKIDAIYLDYLGVVGFESYHPTRPDLDLADVSIRFQAYGKVNKIAALSALQLKAASTKEIRNKVKKVKGTADSANNVTVNTEDLAGSQKIIHDADNSIGLVLDENKPPTKIHGYITKARDNEAYKFFILDFDGSIGRISDPTQQGIQAQDIAKAAYNSSMHPDDNDPDDDLFAKPEEKKEDSKEENKEEIKEEKSKSKPKKEIELVKEDDVMAMFDDDKKEEKTDQTTTKSVDDIGDIDF
jgi:replicative DNA helicase